MRGEVKGGRRRMHKRREQHTTQFLITITLSNLEQQHLQVAPRESFKFVHYLLEHEAFLMVSLTMEKKLCSGGAGLILGHYGRLCKTVSEELWVKKYAPKSFTELLSDENTNREVLMWLKQWDHPVFGADIRNTEEEVLSALRQHSSTSSMRKNTGGFKSIENHGGGQESF